MKKTVLLGLCALLAVFLFFKSGKPSPSHSPEDTESTSRVSPEKQLSVSTPAALPEPRPTPPNVKATSEESSTNAPFSEEFNLFYPVFISNEMPGYILLYRAYDEIPDTVEKFSGVFNGKINFASQYGLEPLNLKFVQKFRAKWQAHEDTYLAVTSVAIYDPTAKFWRQMDGKERTDFQWTNPYESTFSTENSRLRIAFAQRIFPKTVQNVIFRSVDKATTYLESIFDFSGDKSFHLNQLMKTEIKLPFQGASVGTLTLEKLK